jgi:hypothetical protein
MIEIRATESDRNVSGSPDDLQSVRAAIAHLVNTGESAVSICANGAANPKPYDFCIQELLIVTGNGPTRVQLRGTESLVVCGAIENIEKFGSWFDYPASAESGAHGHYEFFEGNEYISSDSVPLVISVHFPGDSSALQRGGAAICGSMAAGSAISPVSSSDHGSRVTRRFASRPPGPGGRSMPRRHSR